MSEEDSTSQEAKLAEISGVVTEIRSVVTGGETYFYIKLNSSESFYKLSAANAEKVVILNVGDTVTFSVDADASGEIIEAKSMK